MPATQGIVAEREDLRAAVVLAKKLSNQVETTNSGFTDTFIETVNILRNLSCLEVTLKKGNAGDDKSTETIVLSSRLSYLTNYIDQCIYLFYSYTLDITNKTSIFISISLSPDVPPPNFS